MKHLLDLHIHTTASDGSDSPAKLAEHLSRTELRLFSITDHDTIEGALEMEHLVPEGMRYIRGVEFSCISPGGKCHILGYGYDPEAPAFRAALEEGRQLRLEKLERRLRHLETRFGVVLTPAERDWLLSRTSPGKPHLGQLLRDRGMAPDIDSAIRTYLDHVPGRARIGADTAIRAIAAAGGVSVWAHPLGGEGETLLTPGRFDLQLRSLLELGIRGMECWYSRYSLAQVRFLLDQARQHELIVTGGSDYHGTAKQDLPLGRLNTENAPCTIDLNALTQRLDTISSESGPEPASAARPKRGVSHET